MLLTWNCRHIANGAIQLRLRRVAEAGAVVSVVSQHRFAPDVPRLHALLRRGGARGELRVRRNRSAAYLARAAADPSGATGVAFTIGVHWVDLLVAALGSPAAVERGAGRSEQGVQLAVRAVLRWPEAEIALDLAWGPGIDEQPDSLSLHVGGRTAIYADDCLHHGAERCAVRNRGLIGLQLCDFVASLPPAAGRAPKVTLAEAERALRACEALL
jgi:predicted dehydrogenase